MAENKNAFAGETANENSNAAITERLDTVAERMAEAEKATAAAAEERSLRQAEQEQQQQQLLKSEEERRAQAAETAKSVADRRAAVLDYTENYRQNQKIAKAARANASKAKLERLAAEAEEKARAAQEAEEALRREREELMERRNRSASLLNKMENDSEAQAPEAQSQVAAPAEEAMPKEAIPSPDLQTDSFEEGKNVQDDTPDILDIEDIDASDEMDDAASVAIDALSEDEDGEIIFIDDEDDSSAREAAAEMVNNDLMLAAIDVQEQLARDAEVAKSVDDDITKVPFPYRVFRRNDRVATYFRHRFAAFHTNPRHRNSYT